MELFTAIKTRRSLAQLKSDPVPRELIEQLLEAAIWAPNHKKVEPWKFWVFQENSREKLADAIRQNYRLDHPDADEVQAKGSGEKSAARVLATPVTIVVTSENGASDVEALENYGATCVAVEHMLLAAHSLGLGAYWRTGEAAYTAPHNAIKELIGISQSTQITALLLIGFPEVTEKPARRAPFSQKTTWFND